jgi:hypothetical protein
VMKARHTGTDYLLLLEPALSPGTTRPPAQRARDRVEGVGRRHNQRSRYPLGRR